VCVLFEMIFGMTKAVFDLLIKNNRAGIYNC